MAEFPHSFVGQLEVVNPRSDGELGIIAQELALRGMVATLGTTLKPAFLGALSSISRQEHVEEFCPGDVGRFGSLEQTSAWLGKNGGRGMANIHAIPGFFNPTKLPAQGQVERLVHYNQAIPITTGWSGESPNDQIPEANITTAYRVSKEGIELARRLRKDGDNFRLGLMQGRLVVAAAIERYRALPEQLSLETWLSNRPAAVIYDQLGFYQPEDVPLIEGVRPTVLHEAGDIVNGNPVYLDEDGRKVVKDYRVHMRYDPDRALMVA